MENEFVEVVDALLARQTAGELMLVSLALAIAESGQAPMAKIVEMMEFMRAFADVTESAEVAEAFDPTLERLRVARASEPRPRSAFALLLAMHVTEEPRLRDALRTWLATATEEELTDELRARLAQLGVSLPG